MRDRSDRRSGDWVARLQFDRELWTRFQGEAVRWWMARTGGVPPWADPERRVL